MIPLGADVVADEARATYRDGILRVELPLVQPERAHALGADRGRRDQDVLEGE